MAKRESGRTHVLIVDDDSIFSETLHDYLESNSFEVTTVASVVAARAALQSSQIDLVVLDGTLPGEGGFAFAAELRAARAPPFIIVSARNDVIDRVVGLEIGADDYLSKPVQLRELLARINVVLRRRERSAEPAPQANENDIATLGNGASYHVALRLLKTANDSALELTTAEDRLLHCLLNAPGRAFTREQIGHNVYGADWDGFDRSIDQLICRLRKKLENSGADARHLQTMRSEGYRWTQSVAWSRAR